MSTTTAERSLTALCPTHGWPLLGDGQSCALCARDAEAGRDAPVCPPHAQWPREFKVWLFDQWLLEASQCGAADEVRRQRSWEMMLHMVAGRRGVRLRWVTAAGRLYHDLLAYFNRRGA